MSNLAIVTKALCSPKMNFLDIVQSKKIYKKSLAP